MRIRIIFIGGLLIGLFALFFLSACDPCSRNDDDIIDAYSVSFNCRIVTEEGQSLIGSAYDHERVTILDEEGMEPLFLSIEERGEISFIFADGAEPVDSLISKSFYVHFQVDNYHPEEDIDTIDFRYQISPVQCGLWYESWEFIYNNDSLYTSESIFDAMDFVKR